MQRAIRVIAIYIVALLIVAGLMATTTAQQDAELTAIPTDLAASYILDFEGANFEANSNGGYRFTFAPSDEVLAWVITEPTFGGGTEDIATFMRNWMLAPELTTNAFISIHNETFYMELNTPQQTDDATRFSFIARPYAGVDSEVDADKIQLPETLDEGTLFISADYTFTSAYVAQVLQNRFSSLRSTETVCITVFFFRYCYEEEKEELEPTPTCWVGNPDGC